MSYLFYLNAIFSSVLILMCCRFLNHGTRFAWLIFTLSYLLTTVLGGVVLGLPNGIDILSESNQSLEIGFIHDAVSDKYWFMLFAPIIFPSVFLIVTKQMVWPWEKYIQRLFQCESGESISFTSTVLCTVMLVFYCFYYLLISGNAGNFLLFFFGNLNFQSIITLRSKMMDQLGGRFLYFYEIIYVSLPSLSWISLYRSFAVKSLKWRILYGFQFIIIIILSLSSLQKAPLMIYFVGCFVAFAILKNINILKLLIFAVFSLYTFTFLQDYYEQDWDIAKSILHSSFRLSSSFLYYLEVYPNYQPFQGINYGLGLLGLGVPINDNNVIFDYMYSGVDWVQGSAAAACHLRGYSQGGVAFAFAILVVVCVLIKTLGVLLRSFRGGIGFAFIVQSCLMMYYLTQTSFRGATLESYGILWSIFPLWIVYVTSGKKK